MNKKQSLFHIAKRDTLPWYKSFAIRGCAILLALVVPAFKNRTTLIRACSGATLSLAAIPFAPVGLPVLLSLFGLLTRKK